MYQKLLTYIFTNVSDNHGTGKIMYLQNPFYLLVYVFWLKLVLIEILPYCSIATLNLIIITE
jgi:hypothetical protein